VSHHDRGSRRRRAGGAGLLLCCLALAAACRHEPPARRYALEGQILAVQPEQHQLTIKHGDIPGLMPAMTMSYPAEPALLKDRVPGELVTATLEVSESTGRIVAIAHVGFAPLPDASNEVGLAANLLDVGNEVPDAALVDQANHRRSLSEWRGSVTLVTFIYTRCPLPTFCPLMEQNFATLQREMAHDPALQGHVKLVTISFDPDHDTPDVLAAHAARLGADPAVWTFLTGDRITTDRVAARFGVGVIRSADDPATITHNLRTALVGADGRLVRFYAGNDWTPGQVLADLRATVRVP
jgi:protein SCO1/2